MSKMIEKCNRNKNEVHDGGVQSHARKYKKAIIKEWLCDMSELFRPLPMGVTASYNTIGFLSDKSIVQGISH